MNTNEWINAAVLPDFEIIFEPPFLGYCFSVDRCSQSVIGRRLRLLLLLLLLWKQSRTKMHFDPTIVPNRCNFKFQNYTSVCQISWKQCKGFQFEFVFLTFYGDEIYFRYPVTYVLYFVRLHLALWTNKFKNSFSDYENLTQPSSFYKKMLLIFSLDFYAILTFFRTPNIITNSRKFFEITFSMKVPTEAQNF